MENNWFKELFIDEAKSALKAKNSSTSSSGGGNSGTFIVTATMDDNGSIKANHTVAEILAAVNDEKCVRAEYDGMLFDLAACYDDAVIFYTLFGVNEIVGCIIVTLYLDGSSSITQKQIFPATSLSDDVYTEIDARISTVLGVIENGTY